MAKELSHSELKVGSPIYSVKLAGSDRPTALMRYCHKYINEKTILYYWEEIDTLETFDYHNYDVVEQANMVCQKRELIYNKTYLVNNKGKNRTFLKLKYSIWADKNFWSLDGTTYFHHYDDTDVIYELPKEEISFSLKINLIKIITGSGPDYLVLKTDLPNGCFPFDGKATLKLEVAAGSGERYCRQNFPGVEFKVINIG